MIRQSASHAALARDRGNRPTGAARASGRHLEPRSFGLTDPGKSRPSNEDQFAIEQIVGSSGISHASLASRDGTERRGHLFIVADGVGGGPAGHRASALAVAAVHMHLVGAAPSLLRQNRASVPDALEMALTYADRVLFADAAAHPERAGMATTLTIACSVGADLFVAHVGDSRCYLFRAGSLRQLTRDHRIVQELVSHGLLTPDQVQRHPLRNVLSDAIGGTNPGIRPDVGHVALEPGDALLLCTDGLTEMLSDEQISSVMRSSGDPEATCRRLVDLANDAGGLDNVTVVVTRYDSPRARHPS